MHLLRHHQWFPPSPFWIRNAVYKTLTVHSLPRSRWLTTAMRAFSPLSSLKMKTAWWLQFWEIGRRFVNSPSLRVYIQVRACPMSPLQIKATAVIQMFHANPNKAFWTKFSTGIVCFVKDNTKRSYYIRLLDLKVSSQKGLVRRISRWWLFLNNNYTIAQDRDLWAGDLWPVHL